MVETSVKSLLQRLRFLILEENEVSTSLLHQIQKLKNRLVEIESFLGEVDKSKQEDGLDCNWENEFIGRIQNAGSCVDQYVDKISRCQDGSDQALSIVEFCSEIEKINEGLATVALRTSLNRPPTLDLQAKEETGQSSSTTEGVNIEGEESLTPFALNYESLPSHLRSCLLYCSILHEKIRRGRLVRLLVAEALFQQKPGEVMEDLAEENISELICQGMLRVEIGLTQEIEVVDPYHRICLLKLHQGEHISCSDSNGPEGSSIFVYNYHGETITTTFDNFPIRSLFFNPAKVIYSQENVSGEYWDRGIPDGLWASWASIRSALHTFKLLRVLELKFFSIKSLPEEIGDLIHLRYLGLKYALLREIPESIGNLQNLQTLDIRLGSVPRVLPSGVVNLLQLRHLMLPMKRMKVPSGIGMLTNLQSLSGLTVRPGIVEELRTLTQLRKLKLKKVSEEHASELSAAIMNMKGLLCLSIRSENPTDELLPTLDLSTLPFLRNLSLCGRLIDLPDWICSMESLIKLSLSSSHLTEEAILALQFLPNLKHLSLGEACNTKQMNKEFCGLGGFPKLEILSICSRNLVEWTEIEKGALPNLEFLCFHNCPRLISLPEGLQYVSRLKVLQVLPMHPDLGRRLKQDGGKENYKIKHIPELWFYLPSRVM